MFCIKDKIKKEIKGHVHKNIIIDFFSKKEHQTDENVKYIFDGYAKYQEFYDIFSHKEIFFESFFVHSNTIKEFERFNDTVYKTIVEQKTMKVINRCFSRKHREFIEKKEEALIEDLVLLGYGVNLFKKNLSKKVALIKSKEDMRIALNNLLDQSVKWSMDLIQDKIYKNKLIEDVDYKIIKNEENRVFIKIFNFKSASILGSSMWCITRSHAMFEHYQGSFSGYNSYLFEFNFNLDYSNVYSNIAYLYDLNNVVNQVFLKNDEEVTFNKETPIDKKNKSLVNSILLEDGNSIPLFIDRLINISKKDFSNNRINFYNTIIKMFKNPFEKFNENALNSVFSFESSYAFRENISILDLYKEELLNDENHYQLSSDVYNEFLYVYLYSKYIDFNNVLKLINHKEFKENSKINIEIADSFMFKFSNEHISNTFPIIDSLFRKMENIEKCSFNSVFKILCSFYEKTDNLIEYEDKLFSLLKYCIQHSEIQYLEIYFKIKSFNIFNQMTHYELFYKHFHVLLQELNLYRKESLHSFLINEFLKNDSIKNHEYKFKFYITDEKLDLFRQFFVIDSEKDLECLNLFIFKEISNIETHLKRISLDDGSTNINDLFEKNIFRLQNLIVMTSGVIGRSRFYTTFLLGSQFIENLTILDVYFKNIDNKSNIQRFFNNDKTIEDLYSNFFKKVIFDNYLEKDLKYLLFVFEKYNVRFNNVSKNAKKLFSEKKDHETLSNQKLRLDFFNYLNKR